MNPDLPPPNRALGWYRLMLWMMPTCIAITTAFGIIWVANRIVIGDAPSVILWCILNLASVIGIGIFEARFDSEPIDPELGKRMPCAVRFVLVQLFIIPSLSFVILFAFVQLTEF